MSNLRRQLPFIMHEGDKGGGAGGEGDKNDKTPPVEMVEIPDPVTGSKVQIPKEYSILLGHVISKQREEVEGKYKPLLKELDEEKERSAGVQAQLDKIKEESMSAQERAEHNAKKVIDEHEKKRKSAEEETAKFKALYFKTIIRNSVHEAFGDTKLCNPEQTAILFEAQGTPEIEEVVDGLGKPTGEFQPKFTFKFQNDNGEFEPVSGSAKELFKKWIELPENWHHIQNDLPPGGNSRGSQNRVKQHGLSDEDYNKLSPSEKLKMARKQQSNN